MSDYTPTTEEVREAFATRNAPVQDDARRAMFDRWQAAHDAEVRSAALETYSPEKDERLVRFMAMATPLGYQSALTVVQEMTKLLTAEDMARATAQRREETR